MDRHGRQSRSASKKTDREATFLRTLPTVWKILSYCFFSVHFYGSCTGTRRRIFSPNSSIPFSNAAHFALVSPSLSNLRLAFLDDSDVLSIFSYFLDSRFLVLCHFSCPVQFTTKICVQILPILIWEPVF